MRSRKLIVVCAIAAIGLAACGSSSKTSSTARNSSTGTTTNGSGSGTLCDQIKSAVASLSATDFSGKSANDLKAQYSDLQSKLKQIETKAPSALKGDFA